jgi:hypothetical protein
LFIRLEQWSENSGDFGLLSLQHEWIGADAFDRHARGERAAAAIPNFTARRFAIIEMVVLLFRGARELLVMYPLEIDEPAAEADEANRQNARQREQSLAVSGGFHNFSENFAGHPVAIGSSPTASPGSGKNHFNASACAALGG